MVDINDINGSRCWSFFGAIYAKANSYEDQIYVPDSFYNIEALGGSAEDYLNAEPCYKENRDVLLSVQKDLTKIIEELTSAKRQSDGLAREAMKDHGSLKGGEAQLSHPPAQPQPIPPQKGRDIRKSEISETKKEKKSKSP